MTSRQVVETSLRSVPVANSLIQDQLTQTSDYIQPTNWNKGLGELVIQSTLHTFKKRLLISQGLYTNVVGVGGGGLLGGGGMGGFEIDWYITSMKLWQSIAEGPLIISWGKERNK